jgi:hypothetical protein
MMPELDLNLGLIDHIAFGSGAIVLPTRKEERKMSKLNFFEVFKVDLPEINEDGFRVSKFDTRDPEWAINNIRYAMDGRGTEPGEYTMLVVDGVLWMSDTNAEAVDHYGFWLWVQRHRAKRILINGLGMGCIVHSLLAFDFVQRIDIVEFDQRVIDVIGAHYTNDPRVHITHADAYEQTKQWPKGTTWDAAWHDIWPDLCEDNLPEMKRLHQSYGTRVKHQESWGKEYIIRMRQQGGWR